MKNNLVKLRALEPEDINFLFESENNPDIWELSNTLTPFSKHILKEYIKNSRLDIFTAKQLRLAIETVKNKRIAGMIDLFDYDPINLRAGIGIIITEHERRKAYASNSLNLIIDYSFQILKINQLYCNISEDNIQSLELFKKLGFKISGKKEQWINTGEGFKDVYFLQLFNE